MEDQKHLDEQIKKTQAVKFDSDIQENDIEELERREAPKLAANHNETMLRTVIGRG
jgi:hypothetical protein